VVSWGTLRGPAAWAEALRKLLELAPDTGLRVDHARMSARAVLFQGAWVGTRDGGQFEIPVTAVIELDEAGRQLRLDTYDDTHLDDALARFDAIAASATPPEQHFANTAARVSAAIFDSYIARDWQRFESLFAAGFRYLDRRRIAQLELDREQYLAFTHELDAAGAPDGRRELQATRGERLALQRFCFKFAGAGDVGPSEIGFITVVEADADGACVAFVRFDADDLDAAYAELDARYEAGEGAAYVGVPARYRAGIDAINRREWSRFVALYAPGFEQRDHRVLGWGNTLNNVETWVRAQQALVELSPDARYRVDHVRVFDRVLLSQTAQVGTREGGAFENLMLLVGEWDEAGRVLRFDSYDLAQADEAYARFEELRARNARGSKDPNTKANRAHEAMNRWQTRFGTAIETGDWEPLRRLCAPGFTFEDRRRLVLLAGDVELMIASARERVAIGARAERRLIGTAGDRICISRMLWSGGPADGRFEIEYLGVTEVDEAGQFAAILLFDVDDARAAQRHAWGRWAVIDPVAAPWVELLTGLADAWNARDRAGVRATFADDVVVENDRRTGRGRIEGADAYIDRLAVLWDLAPDQRIEFGWSWPALDRHAVVVTLRREGTLADGGAFENEYIWLGVARYGRLTRLELFEPDDLDAALERFAALRPAPYE
jgi:ketosteroid isomerase-like protein